MFTTAVILVASGLLLALFGVSVPIAVIPAEGTGYGPRGLLDVAAAVVMMGVVAVLIGVALLTYMATAP